MNMIKFKYEAIVGLIGMFLFIIGYATCLEYKKIFKNIDNMSDEWTDF